MQRLSFLIMSSLQVQLCMEHLKNTWPKSVLHPFWVGSNIMENYSTVGSLYPEFWHMDFTHPVCRHWRASCDLPNVTGSVFWSFPGGVLRCLEVRKHEVLSGLTVWSIPGNLYPWGGSVQDKSADTEGRHLIFEQFRALFLELNHLTLSHKSYLYWTGLHVANRLYFKSQHSYNVTLTVEFTVVVYHN